MAASLEFTDGDSHIQDLFVFFIVMSDRLEFSRHLMHLAYTHNLSFGLKFPLKKT